MGGQGLGTGVQDAVNLGWKLAQVVKGTSPAALLDTYHAERHPVGARLGNGHPLVRRRIPDLDIVTAAGPMRVFTLLHEARPVLLNLGDPGSVAATRRVHVVDATYHGRWELPVIGEVSAPTALLIRPDGHVAWTGDPGEPGLADALARWHGAPASIRP
jgi:3-(3-hydroxy-phenyl)propionate hydroxylase